MIEHCLRSRVAKSGEGKLSLLQEVEDEKAIDC